MRLSQQVSRAVAWNALLAPLKTAVELVANLIILNVLSPPQFGLIRIIGSAAASLGTFVDLGIDRSLPRFIPEVEQQAGRGAVAALLRVIFMLKGVLLLVFGLGFLIFADRFIGYLVDQAHNLPPSRFDAAARAALESGILAMAPWLIGTVLVLVVTGSLYDGLMATLISYFRQRAWNLIGLAGSVVQPLLSAGLVLAGRGVGGVLFAIVLTPILSVALAAQQVIRYLRGHSEQPPLQTANAPLPWRRFTNYTAISNLLNLSDYLLSSLFAIFLLNNLADQALFGVGTALVRQVLALLYTPLVGIQVPLFARVRGGDGTLGEAYAAIGRILALLLIPGGVGLTLLALPLVLIQYPAYADTTIVVYLLTPCLFLESFLSSSQIVLQVYERYRLLMLTRLPALLVFPLLVWIAPRYGLAGVTLAIGGGRVLMGLTATILAWRELGVNHSWGFIGRITLAATAMAGVLLGIEALIGPRWSDPSLTARLLNTGVLLGVAGAGAVAFFVVLRMLGGLSAEDRRRLLASKLPLKGVWRRVL